MGLDPRPLTPPSSASIVKGATPPQQESKMSKGVVILVCVVLCEVLGASGAFFVGPAVKSDWYK